ncbi:MAG: hypothetical protein ACREBU_20975, partial [Nitrososphaera sp.]
ADLEGKAIEPFNFPSSGGQGHLRYRGNPAATATLPDLQKLDALLKTLQKNAEMIDLVKNYHQLRAKLNEISQRKDEIKNRINMLHGTVHLGVPFQEESVCAKCDDKPIPPAPSRLQRFGSRFRRPVPLA